MKRPWDLVRLRRLWWDGPEPAPGDELQTRSGRRYLILDVLGATLVCVVLPPEAERTEQQTFEWQWASRNRRQR